MSNSAYGVGFLKGWSNEGSRPVFKIVTGVSSGAIVAIFAFLGKDYDDQLEEIFTSISTKDIVKQKNIFFSLLFGDSLMSSKPLAKKIEKVIDEKLLAKIAEEHKKGRRLYIGTIILQQPAYSKYYLELGEISSYPPGYKENAGIFCHNNPWVMIAEARVGNGDRAHDYYTRINPSAREPISDVHRCEPYVYAQMIAGRDAPTHGEAKNSWLTGTAAWNYYAITQWILGIRTSYDGLQISPVIPKSWGGFKATRIFRGVAYHITIERAGEGNHVELQVDGVPIRGDTVPARAAGRKEIWVKGTLS